MQSQTKMQTALTMKILVSALVTSAVLGLTHQAQANCNFSSDAAETARGTVYIDANGNDRRETTEVGISGVSVSNGCTVVVTDAEGNYQLPVHATQILFISKPAAYAFKVDANNIPRFFYKHYPQGTPAILSGTSVDWAWPVVEPTGPLPPTIDFGLLPLTNPSADFEAHGFADPQARFDVSQDMIREDLINPLVGNPYGVDFGLTVGDVVFDNLEIYERHKVMMGLMGIPQWYLPGNHDINFNSPDAVFANETYKRHFGPTYYSFNHGNVHFVALNNVEYAGLDKLFGDERYRGYITDNQLTWLEQDLAQVPVDKLIVIATHIPLVAEAGDGRSEPATAAGTENFARLLQILSPFNTIYGLAGHDTSNSWKVEVNHQHGWQGRPWIAHTLAEVRGNGWTNGPADTRGVRDAMMQDGNPNGFYLLKFQDTKLTPEFIPFPFGADAAQRLRVTLDPLLIADADGAINRGQQRAGTRVVVNLFDGGVRDQVWLRLDQGERQAMTYTVRTDPFVERLHAQYAGSDNEYGTPTRSSHVWEYALPDQLPPGLHLIEIETEDEFGQQQRGLMTFEISLPGTPAPLQ